MSRSLAYVGNPHDSPLWQELADELDRAIAKHPPMHSPHEGHSVIREELDVELWAHVCRDTGRSAEARREAMQVAAMALRYIVDLCDDAEQPGEPPDDCADRAAGIPHEHHADERGWCPGYAEQPSEPGERE